VVLVFGTKKLKNIGGDLGGAVKGFKDGMKEGTSPSDPADPAVAPSQVTASQVPPADKPTIDVEARNKS